MQKLKRRPGRPPFEEFMTFASIKPSGLVDTSQRQLERHTTLKQQTKQEVLNIVIAITHGTSFQDRNIAINKHYLNMKYNLTSLGIIYVPIFNEIICSWCVCVTHFY